jgi:hypothetical protein
MTFIMTPALVLGVWQQDWPFVTMNRDTFLEMNSQYGCTRPKMKISL